MMWSLWLTAGGAGAGVSRMTLTCCCVPWGFGMADGCKRTNPLGACRGLSRSTPTNATVFPFLLSRRRGLHAERRAVADGRFTTRRDRRAQGVRLHELSRSAWHDLGIGRGWRWSVALQPEFRPALWMGAQWTNLYHDDPPLSLRCRRQSTVAWLRSASASAGAAPCLGRSAACAEW